MTPEEAYERGQRDMRDRITAQFRGYVVGALAVYQTVPPGVRPKGDVGVAIRRRNKIRRLAREGA